MSTKSTKPLKGFEDRYPEKMAILNYIQDAVKSVATLYGFEQYDGPVVEPLDLYAGKTSREILEEQSFTLEDRNGQALMLRPEMTPTFARMVAAKSQELPIPIRYFNIGLRYRYEAPQRGRNREFYQVDFDIVGSDSQIADIELLSIVVTLLNRLGATQDDFDIYVNSREQINAYFTECGIPEDSFKTLLQVIDRKDKVTDEDFMNMLSECGLTESQTERILTLFTNPEDFAKSFEGLLKSADAAGIREYIEVNPMITRGLDYYTGLVFEVKSKKGLSRSVLGGGRYDNLVASFGAQPLSGIGFATSDTVLEEFLRDIEKIPTFKTIDTQVLVTVFDASTMNDSIAAVRKLRNAGLSSEVYPSIDKLPKQFKYANRKNIPWVIVIGPEEVQNNTVVLKNMTAGEQESLQFEDAISKISNS